MQKRKKVVDKHLYFWYTVQATFGEVSEWFKEPVLKTGDSERGRGFESHLLRLWYFTILYILSYSAGEGPKWLKGLPWKGSRSLIAARGFKSLLLRLSSGIKS